MPRKPRKPTYQIVATEDLTPRVAVAANEYMPRFTAEANYGDPGSGGMGSNATNNVRRNRAATINGTDEYANLANGLSPFFLNDDYIGIQESIHLTNMAYYNVAIVRNTIEIMTELCDSPLSLKGGSTVSRNFIGSWLKRISLDALKEQFFREFHRSGNVFLYRFDATFDPKQSATLSEIYGEEVAAIAAATVNKLPIRYLLLNPERIRTNNTVIYQNSQYFQMLTPIEMSKLLYPKTAQDQILFNNLDPETRAKIKNNVIPYIPLDQEKLYPIFCKKQDYEPFAVPFCFPVLKQISAHLELQKVDRALARTLDRAILLITNGAKPDDGGISPNTIGALRALLQNESTSRTLVADYTTKAEWLIPDLSKILNQDKYMELNRQINIGLNALFFDDNEKFATASIKAKIFIERLEYPRKSFLRFIQNEINRICDIMSFKQYPEAVLEDISFKDEAEFIRLFTRMAELGILTPAQFFSAVQTGELPDISAGNYMKEIEEYSKQRLDGLFLPLVGASMQDPNGAPTPPTGPSAPAGRPQGAKAPQTKQKVVKPMTATSLASFRKAFESSESLMIQIQAMSKRKHKLKKLNEDQLYVCSLVGQSIMLNEPMEKWNESVPSYLNSVKPIDEKVWSEIEALSDTHNVDTQQACLLYLSQV